jgi:hypothetical protein
MCLHGWDGQNQVQLKPELDGSHLNSRYKTILNRDPIVSEFTLKVRKQQPPLCGGRALKI